MPRIKSPQALNADPPFRQAVSRPMGILLLGYLLLLLIGVGIFRSSAAMPGGNEMSWDRAVFAAVNAATLTGFQALVTPAQYLWIGQMMTLILVLGGVLFALVAASIPALHILRLPHRIGSIIGAAITAAVMAMFVGTLVLATPGNPMGGLFQGLAAFGNCGLTLAPVVPLQSWQAQLILLPLAVLGGVGLPVLMQCVGWMGGRNSLDRHSRNVLVWTAGLFICFTALLLLIRLIDPTTSSVSWISALGSASATSLNTRTAGFPFSFTAMFPSVSMQWIALPLMIVGAAPAGTGGGIKITTLGVLFGGLRDAFQQRHPGRLFAIALAWLGIYAAVGFVCLIALLMTQPQLTPDRLLFLCISALSNVGLGRDPISLTGGSLYMLSATMLLGRLLPLAILYWTARALGRSDRLVG